jgi:membrane associated rhomboid family serine protease
VQQALEFDTRFYSMPTLVMAAQLVVMTLMLREGGILPLAENVMLGPDVRVMLDFGALQGGFVIFEHQWWRLLTAMFVHAGLLHLACNVYVQVSEARQAARRVAVGGRHA